MRLLLVPHRIKSQKEQIGSLGNTVTFWTTVYCCCTTYCVRSFVSSVDRLNSSLGDPYAGGGFARRVCIRGGSGRWRDSARRGQLAGGHLC